MGIENFYTFIISTLFFIITPGMDTVFVLNKSIGEGRKSGIYATLGVNSGIIIHTLLGALGLSVLISKVPSALIAIKYCGATYLVYVGTMALINRKSKVNIDSSSHRNGRKTNSYWSGLVTNTLNPKVALLFLAFFPQFIVPEQINNPIPFMTLGLSYAIMGTIWYITLSLLASGFSQRLKTNPKTMFHLNTISGIVFILMGLLVAY
ncbi:lysine exporter protein (lyse/ygga) [Galbibacter marinus]|uniref:Lysine exporter protein (Lyse/ygga) n=1 Tax=Galbibacter marinus TaxID=555500 RepID=K2QLB3_9FLAO|nr:LysE family translocator [Galbibacter marinus]EKF55542.1 lysine exporter protein (lyse/ygga) [Galbibacter marinus]